MQKLPSRDRALKELDPDQLGPLPRVNSVRYPPLSPKTDYQLRQACAALGRDSKPSGQELNPPPQRPQRAKDTKSHARIDSDPQYSESDGGLIDGDTLESSKFAYKPDADLRDLLGEPTGNAQAASANIGRRREPVGLSAEGPRPKERRKSVTSPQPDQIKSSGSRAKPSAPTESYDTATSTPHTGSSDPPWTTSTAPTSEAITPARSSKRGSNQHVLSEQEAALRADEAAIEWLRIEKEKWKAQGSRKDVQDKSQAPEPLPYPPVETERPPSRARSTSRARSIKDAVQNYIKPGAQPISRSASRESFRSLKSDRRKSPSEGRWRSWSLSRNKSTRRESRPGSRDGKAGGRDENNRGRSTVKPEVNLNRELPPLPSLDNWQEPEPEPATLSTHIASLMRPSAESQYTRSHPATEAIVGSNPHSPVEPPLHHIPLPLKVAHPKTNYSHVVTITSPHPPRISSRQSDGEGIKHLPGSTSMAPSAIPAPVSRTKSPAPAIRDAPATKSRAQSIVSKFRSAPQSNKAPSAPLMPSRPGTSLQVRPSNEFDASDLAPKYSVDANRPAWNDEYLQGREDVYTLTHTKTVGLTSGLAESSSRPLEQETAIGSGGANVKITGLRKRSASGAAHLTSATMTPSRDIHSSGGSSNAHNLRQQISSDLQRDGAIAPWEHPSQGPPPMPPPTSHHGRKKSMDSKHSGDTMRLKSKFSRFFSSTGSTGVAPAKQKHKKGGEWADTLDAVHRHTRQTSRDVTDDSAPPPLVR